MRLHQAYVPLFLCALFSLSAEETVLPARLNIVEAERLLYGNNLSIAASRYGVDASRAARLAATYTPNPNLTIGGEQIKTDRKPRSYVADSGTASNPQYTFRIEQLIETGGKKRLRTEVADMQLLGSEAQVLDVLRLQTLQMKQFFYTALLARENLKSAREILDSVSKTEELLTKQSRQGNIAEGDLIKFQASRIQFERDIATAQLTYEQAIRDLTNILGARPAPRPAGAAELPGLELDGELSSADDEFDLEVLRAQVEERPDVIAAKRALETADRAVDLARAQRAADVTVGGEYQRIGGDNTVGVTFSVPLPLFNNHKAQVCQAEAQRNQASAQYHQAKLQAATDVDKAFLTWTANRKIARLYATQTLEKSKQSLEIVRKAYDRKSASLLDLLEAQRLYQQAVLAAHQSQYDLLASLAQLESAAGIKTPAKSIQR